MNTIDWGQAAVNNTIGFGQGAKVGGSSFSNTKSIELDGVDDYVDCSNPSSLQITGVLSLSAWVKRDASASQSQNVIISKDDTSSTSSRGYLLNVNPTTNKFQLVIFYDSIGSAGIVASTSSVVNEQWTHVMGVNDGTDLKIYINGVLENTNVGGGGVINNTSADFNIGRREGGPTVRAYWNGEIDEVSVWNTDQSANASAIGGTIPTDLSTYNPISWWRCGDGDTSPTLTDNGSGGNNATMTNFSTFSTDVPT